LITPAIASDPYCADAPSRSTSIERTIAVGIVLRSTAEAPRPIVPLTLTSDEACRRFELGSTSVWSGARPRNVAGRMVSVPSARPGRGKLNDGNAMDSAWFSSLIPAFCSDSPETTSTATAVSSDERSATRVPVTTTSPSSPDDSWAPAPCAARTAAMPPASRRDARFMSISMVLSP